MSTFVALGNSRQPFLRLLKAVEALAEQGKLPEPVVIQKGHTEFASSLCEGIPFMEMEEFERHIAAAELVIMQAGGGAVLTARQHKKIPVLVPRKAALSEIIDNHQFDNAANLEKLGKVVVAYEVKDLEEAIQKALHLQNAQNDQPGEIQLIRLLRADLQQLALRTTAS